MAWSDDDSHDESEEENEEANMCLIAKDDEE